MLKCMSVEKGDILSSVQLSHPFDVYMASIRLEAIVKALNEADSTKKTQHRCM